MAGIVPLPAGAAMEGLHPLLNPVVLERLFELTPFKLQDFKNFRLVSQVWNKVSLSKWRQNAWLSLQDKDQEQNEDGEDSDWMEVEEAAKGGGISSQEYLRLLETDEHRLVQHPFRKYSVKNWIIGLQSVNQNGRLDQLHFWNRVGPLMTHLNLEKSIFREVADLRTVIFESTPNLQCLNLIDNDYFPTRIARRARRLDPKLPQHALIPSEQVQNNLTEFSISLLETDLNSSADDVEVEYLPITWMELLIHFPNIKKLGDGLALSTGFVSGTEAEFLEIFETVEMLRRERGPHNLANLKDLDLWENPGGIGFGQRLFSTINRLKFPLQRLQIEVDSTVDEQALKGLLQHPLENLSVDRKPWAGRPFPNFPFGLSFVALKDLCLMGPLAPNLLFLRECPNLEQFWYTPYNVEDGFETNLTLGLTDGNPTRLEKLWRLRIMNCWFSAEDVRKLGELMPNVKNLEIALDDGNFRAVCETWKELEDLGVVQWRIGEETLLGVDEQSGQKFRHPNLTDLENLKLFVMEDVEEAQQGLTEAGILEGIMALPNLEWVSLLISSEITTEVRDQLKRKVPECHIFIREAAAAEVDDDDDW